MLSKEEVWIRKFDACVKKALIQELKYRKRSIKNQRNRFVSFSELNRSDEQRLCAEDIYSVENFRKTVETKLFDAVICNELLYEALQVLTPSNLEILLLKYWGGIGKYKSCGRYFLITAKRNMEYCKNKNENGQAICTTWLMNFTAIPAVVRVSTQ